MNSSWFHRLRWSERMDLYPHPGKSKYFIQGGQTWNGGGQNHHASGMTSGDASRRGRQPVFGWGWESPCSAKMAHSYPRSERQCCRNQAWERVDQPTHPDDRVTSRPDCKVYFTEEAAGAGWAACWAHSCRGPGDSTCYLRCMFPAEGTLTPDEISEMEALVMEYRDIFLGPDDSPGFHGSVVPQSGHRGQTDQADLLPMLYRGVGQGWQVSSAGSLNHGLIRGLNQLAEILYATGGNPKVAETQNLP